MKLNKTKSALLVIVLWACVFLPNLGKMEFKGEEARRVLPAVEMLKTGNWIIPSIAGEDYYNKPPGINWPVAISFMITNQQSELTARIPTVVFLLVFAMMIIYTKGSWLSVRTRFLSAVMFLTCVSVLEKGRQIEIEAIYTCLTAMAVLYWVNKFSDGKNKLMMWLVPGIILGYAMLVKGPVAVIVFYCTVVGICWCCKKWKTFFSFEHLLCVGSIAAITGLWYYMASGQTSADALTDKMSSQIMSRIFGQYNFKQWLMHIVRCFIYPLPWLIFLPDVFNRKYIEKLKDVNIFKGMRIGVIAAFIAINAIPGNQPRYSMPIIALLCFLFAQVIEVNSKYSISEKIWKVIISIIIAGSAVCSIAGLYFVRDAVSFLAIVATAGIAYIIFKSYKKINSVESLAFATVSAIVSVMMVYSAFGLNFINNKEKHRSSEEVFKKLVPADKTIYCYHSGFEPVLYYVREPLKYLKRQEDFNDKVKYLLTKTDELAKLTEEKIVDKYELLYDVPNQRRGDLVLVKIIPKS